jgi:glycerol-3-phosphate dehydrogenase
LRVQRDLDRLTDKTFDVLVVGGGVHGLAIAYDVAQRGLAVALIERGDFGGGASFNHSRTIHGGLRYLQTLDVLRARESIRERRALARIAPHAVRVLPFALPLYHSLTKGRMAMRAAFILDRAIAFDRNRGVSDLHRLPGGRVLSRAEAIERFPGLRRPGLTGAAVWHDYTTPEADRLTFSWAIAAVDHGAVLANYVEAVAPLVSQRRALGVRAIDGRSGREFEVAAKVTVNATAGAFDPSLARPGDSKPITLLRAMNLVTRRDAGDEALGGRSASGRHLFLVPCRNKAIFGTWESALPCAAGDGAPSEAEIASFIAELNEAFPSLDLEMNDVTLVHRGAVPAAVGRDGRVSLETREQIRDHALGSEPIEGLLSVAGTKYTTARAVAERVTNDVLTKLRHQEVPCRTASTPLPGGDLRDVLVTIADARREHDVGLPSDTIPHLVAGYGSRYGRVLDLAGERSEWRTRVAADSPVIGAQLAWAVRHEMALTLADAVIRRTPLGAMGYPGDPAAERAADIVGSEMGWSPERKRKEIEMLRQFYGLTVEPRPPRPTEPGTR